MRGFFHDQGVEVRPNSRDLSPLFRLARYLVSNPESTVAQLADSEAVLPGSGSGRHNSFGVSCRIREAQRKLCTLSSCQAYVQGAFPSV